VRAATITDRDRWMARLCANCTLCRHARRKQRGIAFWLVEKVEGRVCPFCKAYERVYGRKAHEPPPADADTAQ
jgi:hypothetical protein